MKAANNEAPHYDNFSGLISPPSSWLRIHHLIRLIKMIRRRNVRDFCTLISRRLGEVKFFLAEERQVIEAGYVPDLSLGVERNTVFSRIRIVGFVREPDGEFWEKRLACGTQKSLIQRLKQLPYQLKAVLI
jgi:hypothetical protein